MPKKVKPAPAKPLSASTLRRQWEDLKWLYENTGISFKEYQRRQAELNRLMNGEGSE